MNEDKLIAYWDQYKLYFQQEEDKHQEKYKWKVLKQVLDNWDWNAEDKIEMFKNAFEVQGSKNLWMSGNFYPIQHTILMLEHFEKETIAAFNHLFNEDLPLTERVEYFIQVYDEKIQGLQNLFPDKTINYHSHSDSRAIALYLFLQYPEKYYLYKYTMVKNFYDQIENPKIKSGDKSNIENFTLVANDVLDFIKKDSKFLSEYKEFTSKEYNYEDGSLHLLVQDFIYTVATHLKDNVKYWRIGTSDSVNSYWNSMLSENKICIGWKEIGPLNNYIVKNKKQIVDLLSAQGYYENDNRTKSRKAGEIFDFYKKINPGDIVLAQNGFEIKGIGRVLDEYTFNNENDFPHQKEVEWLVTNPNFQNEQGNRTSVYEITDSKTIALINDAITEQDNDFTLYDSYRGYLEKLVKLSNEKTATYVTFAQQNLPILWANYYQKEFNEYDFSDSALVHIKKLIETVNDEQFIGKPNFQNFIKYLQINISILKNAMKKEPLNQILYGPPGTGKTYKTKELAVKIIDGDVPENRGEITKRYSQLKDEGYIHFTTFHQSMSYEDFIEGIKPKMTNDDSGEIEYEIQPGLFKQVCELANLNAVSNFSEAYDNMIAKLSDSNEEYLILKTPKGKEFRVNNNSKDNLTLYTTSEIKKQGVFTKDKLEKQYQGEKEFRGWEGYASSILEYLEKHHNLSKSEKKSDQKYVLIIDEINRGNVSSIFGELITLIETDKRKGQNETIEVTLPYSKKSFSVPENIYIIGTMNTADRSVEALDTALRRRFSFLEILPNPEVLNDSKYNEVDLSSLLQTINNRIELLIDKDHQIGHSYFLNITNFDDLKSVFEDKVIPLLEEYFYGDFGKIGLVLGGDFVRPKEQQNQKILAQNFNYDQGFIEEKPLYEVVNPNEWKVEDFHSIYNNSKANNDQ